MSDYAIIIQVLGVLLALFFIFLTYMNTKTWRWAHVTFTFLVFAASIVFLLYAAMTLKTRSTWVKLHDTTAAALATELEALERVRDGDPADIPRKDSVVSTRNELARAIIDRGRVWRDCVPTVAANTITVATSAPAANPADPAAPAAAPVDKNNIAKNSILHVFKESPPDAQGIKLPIYYLGEYKAEVVTDTNVTLVPTLPLAQDQVQQLTTDANATWAMYEIAPIDGYEYFAGPRKFQDLVPQAAMGVSPQKYAQIIEQYARTGQAATDTDPPDHVWIEVKFTKTHSVKVDADQAAMLKTLDGTPYNSLGQAQIERLANSGDGESVEFARGETGLFDRVSAENLVAAGVAEKVRLLYFRPLHDYQREFHAAYQRMTSLTDRVKDLQRDIDTIKLATDKANAQITLQEADKVKLTEDVAKVQFEDQELKKYAQSVEARLGAVRSQVNQLYRSNKALSRELAALSARMTEEIDRRTREATASAQ